MSAEQERIRAHYAGDADWHLWGPYLAERAWGTVREDYSVWGDAWGSFPHDHARSRVYRWNEDGLLGISDRSQQLCFAIALWNGRDSFLKERLFGLTGPQGNHGEDVKEYYYYLDSTPTHSYMKALYKYPQQRFPYAELIKENERRGLQDFEYELLDTGLFAENHYFDIFLEYAKVDFNDLLIQITVHNRAAHPAPLLVLPTLWYRNTWAWDRTIAANIPTITLLQQSKSHTVFGAQHKQLGTYYLYAQQANDALFTNNETNYEHLYNRPNRSKYVKDAFHRYFVDGVFAAVNPANTGTKAASVHHLYLGAGESTTLSLRLTPKELEQPFRGFHANLQQLQAESDNFFTEQVARKNKPGINPVWRQLLATALWSKQLYHFDVKRWLKGDPEYPVERATERNIHWTHLQTADILGVADTWEYPWYALWKLTFQILAYAQVDLPFAREQLLTITEDTYMHPNGKIPASEWSFDDTTPPILAWVTLRLVQLGDQESPHEKRMFLETMFHRLLPNYTWWLNKTDSWGFDVLEGGLIGIDQMNLFDTKAEFAHGGHPEISNATAWIAFYSLKMMEIALLLAAENEVYEESAARFYEYFVRISGALYSDLNNGASVTTWDEGSNLFFNTLRMPNGNMLPLPLHSFDALVPFLIVSVLDGNVMNSLSTFGKRVTQLGTKFADQTERLTIFQKRGQSAKRLVAAMPRDQLQKMLRTLLDEKGFLSPYGVRSLSRYHEENPLHMDVGDSQFHVQYMPAESETRLMGGNINLRGAVWIPHNYLLIHALRQYHSFYGASLQVECPTGSGILMTLSEVADELAKRLTSLFMQDDRGMRPMYGGLNRFDADEHWREYFLSFEYFHGENGAGLGAMHHASWNALVMEFL